MKISRWFQTFACIGVAWMTTSLRSAEWVTYEPKPGPGAGKHIVFLSGDEEYRSEESLPQLGKILSQRHGFKCTILFSQDAGGVINPNNSSNIPGMALLKSADLVVNQFRFRELPDDSMRHFVEYLDSGKPMIMVRTATHAFNYTRNTNSVYYRRFHWTAPGGGFGGLTAGETWTFHHGNHGGEATRGIVDGRATKHPVLNGVYDVFGPTDVYGVSPAFPKDAQVLMHGQVLTGMNPTDGPNLKKAVMPLVWMRNAPSPSGKPIPIFYSSIGAATDLLSEDLRRLFINASYHLLGLNVPKKADATVVGTYEPTPFGFNKYKKGITVDSHLLPQP